MELVAIPIYCNPVPKKQSVCASTLSCAKEEPPCKKTSSSKDGDTTDCSVSCPLFYVTTLAGESTAGKSLGDVVKSYSQYQSNYLFIYYSAVWKPPNGC